MSSKLKEGSHLRLRALFTDEETLKREERKRRRLLRLEQVRQQSKDIASLVRQKVQIERDKQLGIVKQRTETKRQQWQVRKLCSLQAEYQSVLNNVGKGHADAAKLPDEELIRKAESERIVQAAQKRGLEALSRLRTEEVARRKTDEERRVHFQHVRALENSRSGAVVALPPPESTVRPKSPPPKKCVTVSIHTSKATRNSDACKENIGDIPTWPKKSWPQCVLPLGVSDREQAGAGDGDSVGPDQGLVQVGTCNSVLSTSTVRRKEIGSDQKPKVIQHINIRSVGSLTSDAEEVQLYDHRNLYQTQYDKPQGLAEKIRIVGEVDAEVAAGKENSDLVTCSKSNLSLVRREQERSRQALHRLQVQRDYKQLLGDLAGLTKQRATRVSFTTFPSTSKDNNQQRKMVTAVENLLQGTEVQSHEDTPMSPSPNTPDGTLLIPRDETPNSVPKLNVGGLRPPEILKAVSPGSPPHSCRSAAPVVVSNANASSRHANSSLRVLVQRINEERNRLLQSHLEHHDQPAHVSPNEQSDRHRHLQELRDLEEKVQLHRQQLEEQRTEVQRLDASIVVPECRNQIRDEPIEANYIHTRSSPHDSIVIESSGSEKLENSVLNCSVDSSGDVTSQLSSSVEKCMEEISQARRKTKRRSTKARKNERRSSPSKESMMYSLDVSLSSVVMDHAANSSSGSQSVSLHGVQVHVKVCGEADDTSRNGSIDSSLDCKTHNELTEDFVEIFDEKASLKSSNQPKLPSYYAKKSSKKKEKTQGKQVTLTQDETSKKYIGKAPAKKIEQKTQEIDPSLTKESLKQTTSHLNNKKKEPKPEPKPKELKSSKKSKICEVSEGKIQDEQTSASTSYFSPPERVLSSLTKDIQTLIAMAQNGTSWTGQACQKELLQNPHLSNYINKLLCMSRESIERLHVNCSEVSTPPSGIFHSSEVESDSSLRKVESTDFRASVCQNDGSLASQTSDGVDHAVPVHGSVDDDVIPHEAESRLSHPVNTEEDVLFDLTRQCQDKISALTKMIEEVRKQEICYSPDNSSGRSDVLAASPQPLDSTAYFSPPPQILEWADVVLPAQQRDGIHNRSFSDPYSAAVLQLLEDIRHETAETRGPEEAAPNGPATARRSQVVRECGPPRSKPPVAFWRNLDRCNIESPPEPHELSTIPELGATLLNSTGSPASAPGSPIHTPETSPDLISELMRRNILTSPFAWAKKLNKDSTGKQHSSSSNTSSSVSLESDLTSSGNSCTGRSNISASRETNSMSMHNYISSSNDSCDGKTNILMSPLDLYSSADEVEGDFKRLGIGWVGAMLRKTKEAGALSSTSSSDATPTRVSGNLISNTTHEFKDLSGLLDNDFVISSPMAPVLHQRRGHSTPVKQTENSSGSSLLSGR